MHDQPLREPGIGVAAEDVAAGGRAGSEAGVVGLPAPGEVALEGVAAPVPGEAREAELGLVTPAHALGRVHPERVHLLVQAQVLLEVDLSGPARGAVVAQDGVGAEAEVARVDLEAVGEPVPGAGRRLCERGRNQKAGGKRATDDGSTELSTRAAGLFLSLSNHGAGWLPAGRAVPRCNGNLQTCCWRSAPVRSILPGQVPPERRPALERQPEDLKDALELDRQGLGLSREGR